MAYVKSWDSSVGIATGCDLDGQGLIPDRGKIFLFSIVFRLALEPMKHPIQWVLGAISPRVKLSGHEADHSPSSNA
jgi:hypothetical protein